jgi:hypothetical protein
MLFYYYNFLFYYNLIDLVVDGTKNEFALLIYLQFMNMASWWITMIGFSLFAKVIAAQLPVHICFGSCSAC